MSLATVPATGAGPTSTWKCLSFSSPCGFFVSLAWTTLYDYSAQTTNLFNAFVRLDALSMYGLLLDTPRFSSCYSRKITAGTCVHCSTSVVLYNICVHVYRAQVCHWELNMSSTVQYWSTRFFVVLHKAVSCRQFGMLPFQLFILTHLWVSRFTYNKVWHRIALPGPFTTIALWCNTSSLQGTNCTCQGIDMWYRFGQKLMLPDSIWV